jgi:hypothetical protein
MAGQRVESEGLVVLEGREQSVVERELRIGRSEGRRGKRDDRMCNREWLSAENHRIRRGSARRRHRTGRRGGWGALMDKAFRW